MTSIAEASISNAGFASDTRVAAFEGYEVAADADEVETRVPDKRKDLDSFF